MQKKCKIELTTKQIRVILLSFLISGLKNKNIRILKRKFQNILKKITGNWWTL